MEKKKPQSNPQADCEHCMYYDYDEDVEDMVCIMNLDEDEYASMLQGRKMRCPYFRFYDEYKSVQKQN